MRTFLCFFVALAFVGKLSAADTNSPAPAKVGAADADKYYDQQMIVTGKVAQVTIRPTITYLNLEKPYPDSPFTVVIFHGHSSFYGDANSLKGRSIEIKGKVKNYHDKPEIALDDMKQLTVIGGWDPGTNAPAATPPSGSVPPKKSTNAPPATQATNLPEVM
jgi:DNA/RNA endonuclease YhcR with UshA esterase domain